MRTATSAGTSLAIGTAWYGDPFQHSPVTEPGSPQVTSLRAILFSGSPTSRPTRRSRTPCWCSLSLPRTLRSIEMTHDIRLATSGRPMSSTIRPRCGCTTISRADWSAAAAV